MRNITQAELQKMWPKASPTLVGGLIDAQGLYPSYGITKAIRLAYFWSQVSHECGAGTEMVESLNFSASGLRKIFPTHFTKADANKYGRTLFHKADQVAIGNLAYGGRMGNRVAPTPELPDDGYIFRGRGLIQTTGKWGYAELARLTQLDLLRNPDLVIIPHNALMCALAEFQSYGGLLEACDRDDIKHVTKLINGGYNGLDDRIDWLRRWKKLLGL